MSKFLLTKTGSACKNILKILCHLWRSHAAWIKIQLPSPEKCVNTARTLPLVIPGFLSMPVKADSIAGRKKSVEKNVLVNQIATVSCASPVMRIAQTSLKKSVWQDFGHPMSAMVAKPLVSALF